MGILNISEIAALVCDMLSKKRVGFLWDGLPKPLPEVAGFAWVHYYRRTDTAAAAVRSYDLASLRDPLSEGNTLDMLVVPGGTLEIILEIASKITVSPASKLAEGALRSGVPVIFDASGLRRRLGPSTEGELETLRKIALPLKKRGMEFMGLEDALPLRAENAETAGACAKPRVVTLRGSWLTWNEISALVADAEAVRLAAGTKLTPESRDRLLKLNIRVEEAL
jgi:hypothetical protein